MHHICGKPEKQNIEYYSKDDQTLGGFLRKTATEALEKCGFCHEKKHKHIRDIYHKDGYIEISVSVKEHHTLLQDRLEHQDDKATGKKIKKTENYVTKLGDIMNVDSNAHITMHEECKTCRNLVIKKKTLSSDLQEYSFTRFISQYFYNSDLVVQNTDEFECENSKEEDESFSSDNASQKSGVNCEHNIHRDMIRTFTIKGIKIKMKYKKIDTYSIDIVKFRDIDNSTYLKNIAIDEYDTIKENFPCCIKELHEEFQRVRCVVSRLLKNNSVDERFTELYQNTLNLLKGSEDTLEAFEKDAFHEIARYAGKEHDKNDIFELILLRKKLFIQLFNHICILFKGKRLLRRITDYYKKLDQNANRVVPQKKPSKPQTNKLEHASSTSRFREQADDAIRMAPEAVNRHSSVNECPSAKLQENLAKNKKDLSKEMPDFLDYEGDIHSDLVQEKRQRKTSIDIIDEEKEDMIDPTESSVETPRSVVVPPVEVNSEVNEIATDVQINISNFDNADMRNYTEDVDSNEHFTQLQDNVETDIFENIHATLQGTEADFMSRDSYKSLKQGLMSLDCGINSVCIPINKHDVGSIIAFSLNSNCYYEGLARQNYMEFRSKIDQNSSDDMSNTKMSDHTKSTNLVPPNGPKDYLEKRTSITQLQHMPSQRYGNKNNEDSKNKKEKIKLNDKTDVLDSEYQPHHIESEFLSYEKINFKLKWSTMRKDMKMKVFINIFRFDHINEHVQEYCHKNKDIDEIVLPQYSKYFLEDKNIVKTY